MILDTLDRAARYEKLHPHFAAAFRWLRQADPSKLSPGRHEVDGDRLYVMVDHKDGRGRAGARLEVHRKYIDIQLTTSGCDEIGWLPASECRMPAGEFDAAKDIGRYEDAPTSWATLPVGTFAIYFPEDAHAPLGGAGPIRKLIAKVAVAG
jgi:YhcH/YjgK/YiaL family protein